MGTPAGEGAQGAGSQPAGSGAQPTGGSSPAGQGKTAGQQGGQQAAAGQDDNALYAKYLNGIPSQIHPQMIAAFKDFDGNVTRQQQQVRSQYEPWQGLMDAGADPAQAQVGLDFLNWLQENPAEALPLIAQQLGVDFGGPAGEAGAAGELGAQDEGLAGDFGSEDPDGNNLPPQFQQFGQQLTQLSQDHRETRELLNLLAQDRVQQHESQQMDEQVTQLETELTPLLQQAGIDPNDPGSEAALDLVFSAMERGQSPADAVARWTNLQQSVAGRQASAGQPQLLGAGGGMPTEQVDPATLSQKDRRALAVQSAMRHRAAAGG